MGITFEATPLSESDPVEITGDNVFEYREFAVGRRITSVVTMATVSVAVKAGRPRWLTTSRVAPSE